MYNLAQNNHFQKENCVKWKKWVEWKSLNWMNFLITATVNHNHLLYRNGIELRNMQSLFFFKGNTAVDRHFISIHWSGYIFGWEWSQRQREEWKKSMTLWIITKNNFIVAWNVSYFGSDISVKIIISEKNPSLFVLIKKKFL